MDTLFSGKLCYAYASWFVEIDTQLIPLHSDDANRLNSFDIPNATDPDTYIGKEVKFYQSNGVARIAWTKKMEAFKQFVVDEYKLWSELFTEYEMAIQASYEAQKNGRIELGTVPRDEYTIGILKKKYKIVKL